MVHDSRQFEEKSIIVIINLIILNPWAKLVACKFKNLVCVGLVGLAFAT